MSKAQEVLNIIDTIYEMSNDWYKKLDSKNHSKAANIRTEFEKVDVPYQKTHDDHMADAIAHQFKVWKEFTKGMKEQPSDDMRSAIFRSSGHGGNPAEWFHGSKEDFIKELEKFHVKG